MKIKIFLLTFFLFFFLNLNPSYATTEDTLPDNLLDYINQGTTTTTVPTTGTTFHKNWVIYDPDPDPCEYPELGCQITVDTLDKNIFQNSLEKINKIRITPMQTITFIVSIALIFLAIIYAVYKNSQTRFLHDQDFKMMEFEHRARLEQHAAELEKFKVHELSKDQLEKDYEVKLKQVEFDKFIDDRNFMMTVTKEERDFMLKQRELEIKERQNQNQLMNIIEENKDVQLRIKK